MTAAPVAGGGVLDAMDDAAHALNSHPHARERDALLDARSTVAELIAATKCAVDLTPAEQRSEWPCHKGITTAEKCGRCSRELRVIAALSNIEGAST